MKDGEEEGARALRATPLTLTSRVVWMTFSTEEK